MSRPDSRLLDVLVCIAFALSAPAVAAQPSEVWDVTVAVRVADANGRPLTLRVALPADDPHQRISDVRVTARGLQSNLVQGDEPEVIFKGEVLGGKRLSVSYRVELFHSARTPTRWLATEDPPIEVLEALVPAPLFPSRSILVREFLETKVAPKVESRTDIVENIYQVTRQQLPREPAGKSLALDVLRSGRGKRIGIERCFTTFLRCAQFPAHFVEGIKLDSTTQRKRVYWTEVWTAGEWWPISASGGWRARRPEAYVALTRDGRRVVKLEGTGTTSYLIHAEAPGRPEKPVRRKKRR